MAQTINSTTFSTTYKDDYADSDNYHRVLFNSGRALQARELTQLQTIIQSEIARFGRNVFKEGAAVEPGGITVNNQYEFIKLNTAANPLPNNPDDLVGLELTVKAPDPAIKVKVLEVLPASGTDPATIYVRYTSTTAGNAGAVPVRVPNGSLLEGAGVGDLKVATSDATGLGTKASVAQGSFFVKDHFVFAPPQTITLSKYDATPTATLGFKIVEDIVTTDDTNALFDNQGDTPNLAAPGADRYRIRLILTTQDQIDSDENFVPVFNVQNGLVTTQVTSTSGYNMLNKVLAERTREESGDYVLKNFVAKFDDLNDSNLTLNVSGGVAYVDGYRLDVAPSRIVVPKSRNTNQLDDQRVVANYGSYVLVDPSGAEDLPDITTFATVDLKNSTGGGGSTIGTARVRHLQRAGSFVRYYLFDIQMNPGNSFGAVRSLTDASGMFANFVLEDGRASLKITTDNSLIFPLPITRPTFEGVTDVSMTYQKQYSLPANASTVATGISGSTFTNTSDWVLAYDSSGIDVGVTFTPAGSPLGSSMTIGNLSVTNEPISLAAYVDVPSAQISERQKTLNTNVTDTFNVPSDIESDGLGTQYISLGVADIYKFKAIKNTDSDGDDMSGDWITDNGQRDNMYDHGRLILRAGVTPDNGTLFVKYDHFTHDNGDYFGPGSYFGQVEYTQIPTYTKSNGTTINLRDAIDLRPVKTTSGEFTANSINNLPQPTDTIDLNIEHFVARKDQLIVAPLDIEGTIGIGNVKVNQGIPSINPQSPQTPVGTLPIYDIAIAPYTLSDSDTYLKIIDNRRYTMKDISRLEKRVNRLAELTSLSFLETNTANYTTTDSNGNVRVQSGFIADNFKDFAFSQVDNLEYRASIDTNKMVLMPAYSIENVRMTYDSADVGQVSTKRSSDIITLDYTDTNFLYQSAATTWENVNPFEVIINTGHLELSPESDDWIEKEYTPVLVSGGDVKKVVGTRTVVTRNLFGDSWIGKAASVALTIYSLYSLGITAYNWATGAVATTAGGAATGLADAISLSDYALATAKAASTTEKVLQGASVINNLLSSAPSVSIGNDEVVVGSEILTEEVSDRIISISMIPFMRSKKIYFRAQGLVPNTQYFAFFDGVSVADWVREERFTRYSVTTDEYSNLFKNFNSHPDGATILTTNDDGTLEGSFFIPSKLNFKFRTGSKIFKLLNVNQDNEEVATSYCQSIFTSSGILENREKTIKVTRQINIERIVRKTKSILCFWDPLAQTFLVSQTENPSGVVISKVDVFIRNKPSSTGQPLVCQLRTVTNGYPDPWPIPGAVAYLNPGDVNIPADIDDINSIRQAPTTFTFPEPIYLTPGQEYAIVVAAETTDYEAYVAETYEYIIGSNEARVARQPTLGSLFKSQNGTTWEPDQTKDLMFRLWRAEFETSGTAILENVYPAKEVLQFNPIYSISGSSNVRVLHNGHGLSYNDTVTISGLDSNGTIGGIQNTDIMGQQTITGVDHFGYEFNTGSTATSSARGGGNNVVASRNVMINQYIPSARGLIPDGTGIDASIKLTSGSSYAAGRNTAAPGNYAKDGNYSNIELNEINGTLEPKMIPSQENNSNISGNSKPVTLKLDMSTIDSKVSPIIDLQRTSITCLENSIDRQSESSTSGFNIPLQFVDETSPYGGTSASKHITNIISVGTSAVGLNIIFAAYRPNAAEFKVYYRTSAGEEQIRDKEWKEAPHNGAIPQSDDNTLEFREYDYLIGGQGGFMDEFTSFQVKIVMNSTNSSRIPIVKNLRVIALAV